MYCAIDIEKAGAKFTHKVLAVSFIVGRKNYFKIEKRLTVCFPVPEENEFESRCLKEFWSKPEMKEILDRIRKEACKSEEEAVDKIDSFLNDLEKEYPDQEIEFVSDNPSFDVSAVDYLLLTYKGRLPMRYTSKGKYRYISDPSERLWVMGKTQQAKEYINEKIVEHDHWPENDATYIYASMLESDRWAKELKERDQVVCQIL